MSASCLSYLSLLQRLAQRIVKAVRPLLLHFLLGGNSLAPDLALGEADDVLHLVDLAARDERDRPSAAARAAGAPDAVDVIVAVVRQVVIEDHLDVVHVEPARGHVGRDEELEPALAELGDHPLAHRLRHVAVHLVRRIAARGRDARSIHRPSFSSRKK